MTLAPTSADPTAIPDNARSFIRNACFVGGEWIAASDGRRFPVTDPSSGVVIAEVPRTGVDETRAAIESANAALAGWRSRTANDRAKILTAWANLMLDNVDALATLLTVEQGKPLAESQAEIRYAAAFLQWFGEEGKRTYGEIVPPHTVDNRILVTKEPVGVCAAITPWNFPSAMVTRKAAPAIAGGCTVVLKPAEDTPLSALAIADLSVAAGVPPGVFNVVTGTKADAATIGAEMTSNPIVRKVAFTGSTAVGKLLMSQCAGTLKRLSLELGGNAPFIVFDDADFEMALNGLMTCKYRNTGQTCISANRILVQSSIYDRFVGELVARAGSLVVGSGLDPKVNQGPLITSAAIAKVERHIADAVDRGAEVVVGGNRHARGPSFFEPTVLVSIDQTMAMTNEETFGPVAGIMRFEEEDEAVEIANATPYGLASYFYTRDLARSWRVGDRLESGIVGVNTGFISTEVAPFGGMKESGMGREGSHHGIDEFIEIKYRCIGGVTRQ